MTCQELKQKLEDLKVYQFDLKQMSESTITYQDFQEKQQAIEPKIRELKIELINHKLELAEKILGPDFFGPRVIDKVFGINLPLDRIPFLSLSKEKLEIIKANNQILVLHISSDQAGELLTIGSMTEKIRTLHSIDIINGGDVSSLTYRFDTRLSDAGALQRVDNYIKYDLIRDIPESGWVVIGKNPIARVKNFSKDVKSITAQLDKSSSWEFLPSLSGSIYDLLLDLVGKTTENKQVPKSPTILSDRIPTIKLVTYHTMVDPPVYFTVDVVTSPGLIKRNPSIRIIVDVKPQDSPDDGSGFYIHRHLNYEPV